MTLTPYNPLGFANDGVPEILEAYVGSIDCATVLAQRDTGPGRRSTSKGPDSPNPVKVLRRDPSHAHQGNTQK